MRPRVSVAMDGGGGGAEHWPRSPVGHRSSLGMVSCWVSVVGHPSQSGVAGRRLQCQRDCPIWTSVLSWDSQVVECFRKLYRNSSKLYQIFWKHKSRFVSVRNQRCRLLTKGDSPMTSLHNMARSVSLFSMFLHDSSRFSRCSMAAWNNVFWIFLIRHSEGRVLVSLWLNRLIIVVSRVGLKIMFSKEQKQGL